MMRLMTYFAHIFHEFLHVFVRNCRAVSYVRIEFVEQFTIARHVFGEQQLRRRRVLYTDTHMQTFRQI